MVELSMRYVVFAGAALAGLVLPALSQEESKVQRRSSEVMLDVVIRDCPRYADSMLGSSEIAALFAKKDGFKASMCACALQHFRSDVRLMTGLDKPPDATVSYAPGSQLRSYVLGRLQESMLWCAARELDAALAAAEVP